MRGEKISSWVKNTPHRVESLVAMCAEEQVHVGLGGKNSGAGEKRREFLDPPPALPPRCNLLRESTCVQE